MFAWTTTGFAAHEAYPLTKEIPMGSSTYWGERQCSKRAVAEKGTRIVQAAQSLFIRYGVKRTSIDEVARAADIAKGTLYLYYDSKEMLFAEVAKHICADILVEARRASAMPAPLAERLVGILDAEIGVLYRLVEHSPHVRELTETKEAMASATFATFERDLQQLITN